MLRAVLALMLALFVTGAHARAASPAQNGWSFVSPQHMERMPAVARVAIQEARRLCGGEDIRVRNGFLRYLNGPTDEEFVVVHFDEFHCTNGHALCSSQGCMHRVFFAKSGDKYREVWRGNVRQIDMKVSSGHPSMDIDCGHYGAHCNHHLRWNGSQFRPNLDLCSQSLGGDC
jgi:hypothetical protein